MTTRVEIARQSAADTSRRRGAPGRAPRGCRWLGAARRNAVAVIVLLAGLSPAGASAQSRDDLEFQERVARAIDRGREAMREHLERELRNRNQGYPMGYLALGLTAYLKAGAASDDDVVERSLKVLASLSLRKTYSVACYLMALDAYWQQRVAEGNSGQNGTFVALPREAQGDVRAKMIELLEWLLEARVKGRGIWHYDPSTSSYDYSNTQFAVLGLEIGVENGIRIPDEVFMEIIDFAVRTARRSDGVREVDVEHGTSFEQMLGLERRGSTRVMARNDRRRVRTRPAGWTYQGGGSPTTSMTAAGASNLLVALEGLRRQKRLSRSMHRKIEEQYFAALAWISERLPEYFRGGSRPYYYTLYSLEKVGDLGNIARLDGIDWYRRGAEALLEKQQDDGSWGQLKHTAFALLFLTRATKPGLQALPAPRILTGTGDKKPRDEDSDLVYVDRLEGFISARSFLKFLLRVRNSQLLPIARQVVDNYPPHRRDDLIPGLVAVWGGRSDSLGRFARKSLEEITGTSGKDRAYYIEVYRRSREVVDLIDSGTEDPEKVGQLFARLESLPLKSRLLDFVQRESLVAVIPYLIDELEVRDEDYRGRVHDMIERMTSHSVPRPRNSSQREWESTAEEWRRWWSRHADDTLRRYRVRRLVSRINREATPREERAEALDDLVSHGVAAATVILEAMQRPRFRVELVVALERISGKRLGLRREAWQSWLEETSGL